MIQPDQRPGVPEIANRAECSFYHANHKEGGLRGRGSFCKESRPNKPLISIITVVRNGEKTIEQTIESVLNQTYDNIEYIIVDGNSTDGTIDIIRNYEDRISYWISEPDCGIYDAMNKGIAMSSGVLINLLNADDYLAFDAVDSAVKRYLELNRPCILYGNTYVIDEIFSVRVEYRSNLHCWRGMTVNHQSMFIHADIYKTMGLYDIRYKSAADYDFLVRCVRRNVLFFPLNRFVVSYRNSGISSTDPGIRKEVRSINKIYYGAFSKKRLTFLFFAYVWQPLKISFRTLLYKSIGVQRTRRIISLFK